MNNITKNQALEDSIAKFCKSIDIAYQVDFVREYAKIGDSELYGGKHCGSDAEHKGSEFIAEQMKKIGLSNVELVPCSTSRYQFNDADITVKGEDRVIKPYGYVSPGTDSQGIEAPLVDIIKARKDDFGETDVKGKIVMMAAMGTLEGANLSGQIEAAIRKGVKAIIIYAVEDVLNDETIRVQPPNIISTVPIVGVCAGDAAWLQKKISEGSCDIKLNVDAEFIPNGGTTYNVVGEIPGSISDERIIYTAHLDHYFRCLQDNISTCSTLLGIAKAMLDSGYKPNRTITFAFHGSHETGGMDTRYPYIYGSYKLTHEGHPEWSGKALININFEYTALKMKRLQAVAYMGVNNVAASYYPYSPKLIGDGFESKEKHGPETEYYMLSWSDCISYHSAGIPTLCNDPISEQYYEGTGPYVGRDHSNMDNWDIFDEKILEDVGRYYGCLSIYVDSMPCIMLDYTEHTDRLRREVSKEALDAIGISYDEYFTAVDKLEAAAKAAGSIIEEKNNAYITALKEGITEEDKKKIFEDGRRINKVMLEAYKVIANGTDRINAYDFICLATVKYLQNIEMLNAVKESIKSGDTETAFETLLGIDLAASAYYFDEEVAEHMRKQICDPSFTDRRTWAAGRELNVFTYYDLVQMFVKESAAEEPDFSGTLKLIADSIEKESSLIPASMKTESESIIKGAELIERVK